MKCKPEEWKQRLVAKSEEDKGGRTEIKGCRESRTETESEEEGRRRAALEASVHSQWSVDECMYTVYARKDLGQTKKLGDIRPWACVKVCANAWVPENAADYTFRIVISCLMYHCVHCEIFFIRQHFTEGLSHSVWTSCQFSSSQNFSRGRHNILFSPPLTVALPVTQACMTQSKNAIQFPLFWTGKGTSLSNISLSLS